MMFLPVDIKKSALNPGPLKKLVDYLTKLFVWNYLASFFVCTTGAGILYTLVNFQAADDYEISGL